MVSLRSFIVKANIERTIRVFGNIFYFETECKFSVLFKYVTDVGLLIMAMWILKLSGS
jgi:uncharacterized protein YlbG (UPF0298 family)